MFMRRMNHLQVTYEFYTIVWRIFFKKSLVAFFKKCTFVNK